MLLLTKFITFIWHPLAQAALALLVAFVIFRFVIQPATPRSVLVIYMGIVMVALAVYVSSNEATWRSFQGPIFTLLLEREPWIVGLR